LSDGSLLSFVPLRNCVPQMETEWFNRAEAIQRRITQLRDSL
jgi:hypothetical protein